MLLPAVIGCLCFLLGAAIGFLAAHLRAQDVLRDRIRLTEQLRQLSEAHAEKAAWIQSAESQLREAFQALSAQALRANADEYLSRARQQLENVENLMRGDLGKHKEELSGLMQPLQEKLRELDSQVRAMEVKREGAYKGIEQHMDQLATAYRELRDTTTGLASALTKSSSARGTWGELELRRIVELAGMVHHVDFEQQAAQEQTRPDMVIHMPQGGLVPVDAKTPLDSYRDVTDAASDADRRKMLEKHAQVVRSTIRDLGRKEYWKQLSHAPEFVIMFLPHEGVLSAAFEGDRDLLDFSFQQKVIPTTPVTLLALLKTIGYGWQQQAMAENAQRIAEQGKELFERLLTFLDHVRSVGKSLDGAVRSYNDAIGSWERRLIPSARKLREMGVSTADLPTSTPVDRQPRLPSTES